MKPIDIKKVLEMSEEEFVAWLNFTLPDFGHNDIGCCLDSLARRLRDEAKEKHERAWLESCKKIYVMQHPQIKYCSLHESENYVLRQGPLVWILVALKAIEGK